ncbi:hypothetical protein CHS0354_011427 [Potamilus streckersoni]|uniref:C-mannosyltransferase DPY19L3 n=1 Tax=Potamilus streckersoni TaxID=2493646 RepID=A0AAE0SKT1_9BIVA|nr:hypothetical protein CHS0354_011427 [Potamilus streckersoni]
MPEVRSRKPQLVNKHDSKKKILETSSKKSDAKSGFIGMLIIGNMLLGVTVMLAAGYKHATYMALIHENWIWFSNIQEVAREVSFRTESGLYYSYYKQMVHAPSITQGLYEMIHDNQTEHPSTINVLERMNIYQEVILSILYRLLPIKTLLEPIYFYINSIFALHAMLIWALFATTWMLSNSWLAGVLSAAFYIFNRLDTTRVEYVIPLRESFSLPFLWVQIAAISFFFKPSISETKQKLAISLIAISTFFFNLCWQFNQFIMLLQAFALFGVWILDMVPPHKVRVVLLSQAVSLFLVCLLQFANKMILGSLVMSFIPVTFLLMFYRGDTMQPCSIPGRIFRVFLYSVTALVLMMLLNTAIKILINVEADEHIFKFILNKFGMGQGRDFDSRLYLCIDAFDFLTFDTYKRMTKLVVFPFYLVTQVVLLLVLFIAVMQNWSNHSHEMGLKDHPTTKQTHLLTSRPDLAFHAVQVVFFGALAMSTMRMKYLWTPYMCILAAVGISDYKMWKSLLSYYRIQGILVHVIRHCATLIVLGLLFSIALPPVLQELEDLKEFWDPDTVELMEWIIKETPKGASFTGSMQLMAGVKLCTGRPITNHPHYEDKHLRLKTKELYQVYARRSPEEIYIILKKYNTNYIILEDSICLASSTGCRLPDLLDVDNGHIPDNGKTEPGLVRSILPRFCDEIRKGTSKYSTYFKLVFHNKTFRVYHVL